MTLDLTELDRSSATWAKVVAFCQARLDELRRENDIDRSPESTAKLRGRIAEIQKFLRAADPARNFVAGDDSESPLAVRPQGFV